MNKIIKLNVKLLPVMVFIALIACVLSLVNVHKVKLKMAKCCESIEFINTQIELEKELMRADDQLIRLKRRQLVSLTRNSKYNDIRATQRIALLEREVSLLYISIREHEKDIMDYNNQIIRIREYLKSPYVNRLDFDLP